MKHYRIAIALAARSGLHKTVGLGLVNAIKQAGASCSYQADIYFTGFDQELMSRQIKEIFDGQYDVLFTIGYIFTRTAARYYASSERAFATQTVFTGVKWPVEQGIVRSVKKPGGQMTGVVREGPSPLMQAYFIERLTMSFNKIVIPYSPHSEGGYLLEQSRLISFYLKEKCKIAVDFVPLDDTETATATIEPYLEQGAELVLFLEGCLLSEAVPSISALCQEYGVYLFGDGPEAIKAGADFGYGGNSEVFAHKAFKMIRKICEQGADPATLPLTVVSNNRSYWVNTRLLDRGILSRQDIKRLEQELETKVSWLDTVHESRQAKEDDS